MASENKKEGNEITEQILPKGIKDLDNTVPVQSVPDKTID